MKSLFTKKQSFHIALTQNMYLLSDIFYVSFPTLLFHKMKISSVSYKLTNKIANELSLINVECCNCFLYLSFTLWLSAVLVLYVYTIL